MRHFIIDTLTPDLRMISQPALSTRTPRRAANSPAVTLGRDSVLRCLRRIWNDDNYRTAAIIRRLAAPWSSAQHLPKIAQYEARTAGRAGLREEGDRIA